MRIFFILLLFLLTSLNFIPAHAEGQRGQNIFHNSILRIYGENTQQIIEQRMEQGDPFAEMIVGGFYAYGLYGYPQDIKKADMLIQKNFDQLQGRKDLDSNDGKEALALFYFIVSFYEKGGLMPDQRKMEEASYKVIKNFDFNQLDLPKDMVDQTKARFMMIEGDRYITGDGGELDFERGKALLHQAADEYDLLEADLLLLGHYHFGRDGFEKDNVKALHYAKKMYHIHKLEDASSMIGYIYETGGHGLEKALHWFELSGDDPDRVKEIKAKLDAQGE